MKKALAYLVVYALGFVWVVLSCGEESASVGVDARETAPLDAAVNDTGEPPVESIDVSQPAVGVSISDQELDSVAEQLAAARCRRYYRCRDRPSSYEYYHEPEGCRADFFRSFRHQSLLEFNDAVARGKAGYDAQALPGCIYEQRRDRHGKRQGAQLQGGGPGEVPDG